MMNTKKWLGVYVLGATLMHGQLPTTTSTLGVVTKIDAAARQIVLKTDAGPEVTINMNPTASFRRVAPWRNRPAQRRDHRDYRYQRR